MLMQIHSQLDVGFLNAIDGDLTLTRSSTDCKLRGLLDARSILYSDIASNHKVLKESDVVKLKEGCLFV